ncbi:hypothetical protein CDL31_16220 [Enterobacter kobei]|nr:hypothetical protein CDL31_16220 [Enterobacter kobei]
MSSIRRHCQPLADLTPLIAKLAFSPDSVLPSAGRFNPLNRQTGISPDSVLPSWRGLLTLVPMIRNAPADTD